MHKVVVSEGALRELIREALSNNQAMPLSHLQQAEDEPVKVNDVVDPSAALSNPGNEDFRPNTPAEFQVAVKSLVDDLPSDEIPDIYEKLVKALEDEDEGEKMKKDTKTEAIVRANVRRLVREAISPPVPWRDARHLPGPGTPPMPEEPKAKRKYTKAGDVGGGNLKKIAMNLGMSTSGAKLAVDKALAKAQWVGSMQFGNPEELEVMVLKAVNDYIKLLKSSGELSPAEVMELNKNPEHVTELDGFREFLDKYVKSAMRRNPTGFPLDKSDIPWTEPRF